MRYGVLGPLEMHDGTAPVPLGGPRQRALLAALIAHRGRTVAADVLIDALWGETPPRTAEHTLRTYVSRLRRTIGRALVTRDGGYLLDVPPDAVDAARFDALLAAATERAYTATHTTPTATQRTPAATRTTRTASGPETARGDTAAAADDAAVVALTDALNLWRGPAFAGQFDLAPVRGEARRLEEARTSAREALVSALLDAARASEAVATAEGLVADAPYREGAWALLVRALTAAGRPAEGLEAYRRAAAALDDVGLEPSPVLRAAQAVALRAGDRQQLVPPAPAPPTTAAPPPVAAPPATAASAATTESAATAESAATTASATTDRTTPAAGPAPPGARDVPLPASSLIGRSEDIDAVRSLLERVPVVTLVGPGGVGKTRLALAAARERAGRHIMGARLVELAPLRDPAAVPAAIATALDLTVDAAPPETALARAGALDVLLLLDNCEHVIDAVAAVVESMVGSGRHLRVLATSRERLGVSGEHAHVVEPLRTEGRASPARQLFMERARAATGRTGSTPDEAALGPVVDRVVRRLDGLPLAIEMAAARTATLGIRELADRLDERFDTLHDPRRRGDPRHRTLGAVIEWSEALLGDAERQVLTRWPVFASAVPLSDAAAVLDAGEDVVESLVGRSLLALDTSRPRARYRMLHIVRSTVNDRSGAEGARGEGLERRHAAHFTDVAGACGDAMRGPGEGDAVERLDSVIAELRSAHAWARRKDPRLAAKLSTSLHVYAVNGLHDEVLGWAARLAPAVGPGPEAAAVDATVAARFVLGGEFAAGSDRARRALAHATDDRSRMMALESLADVALYQGRLDEAIASGRRMRELAELQGDAHYVVMSVGVVTLAIAYAGRVEEALRDLEDVGAAARTTFGALAPSDEGWLTYVAGETVLDRDPGAAIECLRRAVSLADGVGNRYLGGVARVSLTSLQARAGEPDVALRSFADVVRHWLLRGNRTHLLTTLRNLVDLLQRVEADHAAAELWGAVSGGQLSPSFGVEAERLERARETLAARLGQQEFGARAAIGRRRDVESAALAAIEELRVLVT